MVVNPPSTYNMQRHPAIALVTTVGLDGLYHKQPRKHRFQQDFCVMQTTRGPLKLQAHAKNSRCVRCPIAASRIGKSGLEVSKVALGTMLFGEMMDFEGAYELLDLAFDSGINFFDTAEMYPVPQRSETQGKSEEFLGKWMATKKRDEVVVSTKVCGPSGQMSWIRGGPHSLDRKNIKEAVEGSLRRLGTDHIDILHLHWPDRYVPMFGEVEYDPSRAYQSIPIREQLDALGECVNEGKVRHAGLSNETAWGLMKFCSEAERVPSRPRPIALQNAYNLLDRVLDMSLAECCHLEGIGVLAYSPLAMGLLTGKYLREDGGPPEARLNKYKNRYAEAESRYGPKPNVTEAIKAYSDLASHWEMSLLELATRFVSNRSLISSVIFGASNSGQLREILAAASKPPLPQELAHEIDTIHQKYPNPTP